MMQTTQSEAWFQRAKEKMPGGVNSPVRAFPSVGVHRDLFVKQRAIISMI